MQRPELCSPFRKENQTYIRKLYTLVLAILFCRENLIVWYTSGHGAMSSANKLPFMLAIVLVTTALVAVFVRRIANSVIYTRPLHHCPQLN